ncbi:neuromedin-S [Ascaphus truei]|uniref:neuromedin-S n=1 Tax=Ascaphus truei TaxID=8439 RepID=UPI003F5A9671
MSKSWKHHKTLSLTKSPLLKMRSVHHQPALPLMFAICCLCALHLVSGFPQSIPPYMEGMDIPESERLAVCFSQWTALLDQPQISNFVMDLCSSIYNRMNVNEEKSQDVYKRFLFHYSRAQDPTLKTGVSILTYKLLSKKDSSGTMGRPFFLFRPRNGRKVSIDEQ